MDDLIDYIAPPPASETAAPAAPPSTPSPAQHNVWMDFLSNLSKGGFGGGAGNQTQMMGHNNSQGSAPNSAAQSAATSAAIKGATGGGGLAGCCA